MARYQRQFGLNGGLPSTGQSGAYQRLAQSLEGFGAQMNRMGATLNAAAGQRDAAAVEPSTEAPELRSPLTAYGANYNDTVLKGHLAATQNAMSRHISELSTRFSTDPAGFAGAANEIRSQYLNGVAPEARQAAAISFDAYANNRLMDIQTRQAQDEMQASMLEQKEGLDNVRATAMESLTRGDEQNFVALTSVYESSLAGSSLSETEKVKALITYKRDANLAVSMGEIRQALDSGNYSDAIEHIQAVRKGSIPMVFADTGMSGEEAADYLQAQFLKYVGDYEADLKATNTTAELADAKMQEVRDATRDDGYELMAQGSLSVDWVKQHREELGDDYGDFLKAAVSGGAFADIEADAGAYVDLMNRAITGEDVKAEAERALRTGQIEKSWYDQIANQIADQRFGGADKLISETLKIDESLGDPFARARNAEAMQQWQQWKRSNPDASRTDAVEEARAIVRDTILVGTRIDRSVLPKPRAVVFSGDKVDVDATRLATIRQYRDRLPPDTPPEQVRVLLEANPDFIQQAELINRWEQMQSRMVEVE